MRLLLLLALAAAASCSALFPFLGRYDIARRRIAVVDLVPGAVLDGVSVTGRVLVHSSGHGVVLQGEVAGLAPGKHGFHVHVVGDTGESCQATLGHFNPDMVNPDEEREAGDLGNLLTHPGHPLTLVSWAAADLTLGDGGPRDIAGRSIVVHAEEDKGARVACGVINLLK